MLLKKYISTALSYLIRKLNQFDLWITKFNYNPNKDNFEDLSAGIEEDKVDEQYQKMILWALRNRQIKNIAVTGPYGSGKTSIIKYFEQTHKQFKFLNISLASFDNSQIIDDKERNLVEWSILQQMFYLVKGKAIPDSRFKRIRPSNRPFRILNTILLMIWALSGLCIFFPDFFCRFLGWERFYVQHTQILQYVSLMVFLSGIFILIFFSFRTFKGSKFNKVNFTNAEIGLAPESESSILNKHLDEIIYFFQATKFDTVIIEDLDRFNDPEIFTKLREINNVINNSEDIGRRIVFIYAVKDDIFIDKTRTKFFDFIIPVIPIINYSNSAGKLFGKLKKVGITNIGEDFINDITLFIEDMRLLKNVVNEYQVYINKIDEKLNPERLFALILYKNLYPDDFAKLHDKKGALYTAFNCKPQYITSFLVELETEEQELQKKVTELDAIYQNNVEELRLLYISAVLEHLPSYSSIVFNGVTQTIEMLKTDGFQELKSLGAIKYSLTEGYSAKNSGISFSSVEAQINTKKTYDIREQEIKLKNSQLGSELKAKLNQVRSNQDEIHSWTLKKIISESGAEAIETALKKNYLRELKLEPLSISTDQNIITPESSLLQPTVDPIEYPNYELLIFMLRNGYIDEMYQSYISHFHAGAITKEDMDFVLSIKVHHKLAFDFKLEKIDQLVKLLHPYEFDHVEALNVNLLDWVIKRETQNQEVFNRLFSQLSNGSTTSLSFIDKYISVGKNLPEFIKKLGNKWSELWKAIYLNPEYSEEKRMEFLKLIIQYVSIEDLKLQNRENVLSDYIAQKKDFLLLSKEWNTQKTEQIINELGVYFKALDVTEEVSEMFNFIYEGWHYTLTLDIIETIIKQKNTKSLNTSLLTANYTTIQASDCQHLKDYVEDYLQSYIDSIFLALAENVEESEATLITLLNKSLPPDTIESIIKKQNTPIRDIQSVPESLWSILLDEFKVIPKWVNLLRYYQTKSELDQHLLLYLNHDEIYHDIGLEAMDPAVEGIDEFAEKILLWDELTDESYELLSMAFPFHYTDGLMFNTLSEKKVHYLIDRELLKLSATNYEILVNNYDDLHLELLKKHFKEFIQSPDEFKLESDDWLTLLEDNDLTPKQKQALVDIINVESLSMKISLAAAIVKLLISVNKPIKPSLLKVLLLQNLSVDTKLTLLIKSLHLLQTDELISSLVAIGGKYADITRFNKRPIFDLDLPNKKLLAHLDQIKVPTIKTIKPLKEEKTQVFTKRK